MTQRTLHVIRTQADYRAALRQAKRPQREADGHHSAQCQRDLAGIDLLHQHPQQPGTRPAH